MEVEQCYLDGFWEEEKKRARNQTQRRQHQCYQVSSDSSNNRWHLHNHQEEEITDKNSKTFIGPSIFCCSSSKTTTAHL